MLCKTYFANAGCYFSAMETLNCFLIKNDRINILIFWAIHHSKKNFLHSQLFFSTLLIAFCWKSKQLNMAGENLFLCHQGFSNEISLILKRFGHTVCTMAIYHIGFRNTQGRSLVTEGGHFLPELLNVSMFYPTNSWHK